MFFYFRSVLSTTNQGRVKFMGFSSKLSKLYLSESEFNHFSIASLAYVFFNKSFKSTAGLLYFINLQLVIPGIAWILL